jgi:hypothetical protein
MDSLFGIILLGIVGVVTWCVASEGAWGAGLTFLCVLFAGLLAMNFFEPVAGYLDGMGAGAYSDIIALVGLFTLFTFLGRLATDQISPTEIEFDARVYQAARWLFALATGYTTMAILLTALHTAPLPREFLGFKPEGNNFFDVCAPDRQWLGFTQHVSEKVLGTGRIFDGWIHQLQPEAYPDPSNPQKIWPSFPIRYATRRQDAGLPPKPGVGASGPPPVGGPPATGF